MSSDFAHPAADPRGETAAIAVSELARRARITLERQFPVLWVRGELSGVTRAASGHLYFSLKDDAAQLRCVMFRSRSQLLPFEPRAGLQVEVRAQVSLYEPRGDFQLTVDAMRQAGVGGLFEAFLRLKAKLEAEGLFDAARKRPLPQLPARIAVVTSPAAAALRDVLAALARRAPHVELVLVPCLVQGTEAPARIAAALAAAGRCDADLVLLVRGGGSAEDLAAFNDERVARAIAACPLPVVSGVGHETDFSIADFVADLRAATPTAAAEIVSAGHVDAARRLRALAERLDRAQHDRLDRLGRRLDDLAERLHPPSRQLALASERLHALHARMRRAGSSQLGQAHNRIEGLTLRLRGSRPALDMRRAGLARMRDHLQQAAGSHLDEAGQRLRLAAAQLVQLDPGAVLSRGYALVRDGEGRIVRDAATLTIGQPVRLQFGQGSADADITRLPDRD